MGEEMKTKTRFEVSFSTWYLEFRKGIRIHFYFNFMINMFPILVIAKFDDPSSKYKDDWRTLCVDLLVFRWHIYI